MRIRYSPRTRIPHFRDDTVQIALRARLVPVRRVLCGLLLFSLSGCISRVLEIRSDPPGARVYLDGRELGRTPVDHPFTHYGTRRILITKEEYKPVSEEITLKAPWWCWFPFDFFVELWPGRVTDRHRVSYRLEKSAEPEANLDRLLRNLDKLRGKLSPSREGEKSE